MRLGCVLVCLVSACGGPEVPSADPQRADAGVSVRHDAGTGAGRDASIPSSDVGQIDADAGPAAGLDCVDAAACAWQCGDDSPCITGCMSRVEPEQSMALRQALICSNDNNCREARCMRQRCAEAWALCSGQDPDPGTLLNCSEMLACVRACNDADCRQACITRGGPAEQESARAVLRCGQTNQCNGRDACFNEFCADELAQCRGEDPGTNPGDALDCSGYVRCRLGCRNMSCAAGCFERVSADEQRAARQVNRCVQTNQCRDVDCIVANCPREAVACGLQGGGGQDALSCSAVLRCVNDCANDQACAGACIGRIRGESSGRLDQLTRCMSDNNCRNMRCAQRRCGPAYQACNADR